MSKLLTLQEIEVLFKTDPIAAREYMRQREEIRLREVAANLADEASLVREINAAGVRINSVDDLINTNKPYPAAIPVLLRHLELPHRPAVRDGIIRSLMCKEAKGLAWDVIKKVFLEEQDTRANGVKWVAALALTYHAGKEHRAELRKWAEDESVGEASDPIIKRIKRSTRSKKSEEPM